MPTKPDARALLARMERACAETAHQFDIIDRQIAAIDAFRQRHRINEPSSRVGWVSFPVNKSSIRCHDSPIEQEGGQAADKTARNDKGEKRWPP